MTPKIIHYCWFGRSPLPKSAIRCINSWSKFFPDYEIKEWNEDNFDVNAILYTRQAYSAKKYAFVSDYARFWILYNYGGLYFDVDVEVIRPLNDIVDKGCFMGCENSFTPLSTEKNTNTGADSLGVNPGLGLCMTPGHPFLKQMIDMYHDMYFILPDGSLNTKTIVSYTTEILSQQGLCYINEIQQVAGIWIYPKEYFCPKDYYTNILSITPNTRTIHHYSASWVSGRSKTRLKIKHFLGPKFCDFIRSVKKKMGLSTVE